MPGSPSTETISMSDIDISTVRTGMVTSATKAPPSSPPSSFSSSPSSSSSSSSLSTSSSPSRRHHRRPFLSYRLLPSPKCFSIPAAMLRALLVLLVPLLEMATGVSGDELAEGDDARGSNSALAFEVELWVPIGVAGLFFAGFMVYCCRQVRGTAKRLAEIEEDVGLEIEAGLGPMQNAPRIYGMSKDLTKYMYSSEDKLSPLHCPSPLNTRGSSTDANTLDGMEGGESSNDSGGDDGKNIRLHSSQNTMFSGQAGQVDDRLPSKSPDDTTSITVDTSLPRDGCSDVGVVDGGGDIVGGDRVGGCIRAGVGGGDKGTCVNGGGGGCENVGGHGIDGDGVGEDGVSGDVVSGDVVGGDVSVVAGVAVGV